MDPFEIITGRTIVEFVGASVRFLYLNIATLLNRNDFRTFSGIWSPSGSNQKRNDNSDQNHMIGVLFLGAFIMALIIFNV